MDSRLEDEVEAFHQERVHLDPLGEGELAQLIVNGGREVHGLLDRRGPAAARAKRASRRR